MRGERGIKIWKIGEWLVQLGELRFAERDAAGSNPDQTNIQGLEITEEKVLPLQ